MLIRGQTLLGQTHQPDDVVRAFIQQAVEDGIHVVRMFDPLKDVRNLEVPVEAAHKAGARVIGALVYSPSAVEDEAWLVRSANRLKALGADWIGIEDVAGILAPAPPPALVSALLAGAQPAAPIHLRSTTTPAPLPHLPPPPARAAGAGARQLPPP